MRVKEADSSSESGTAVTVDAVTESGPAFKAVLALWRAHRRWLGFLPTQGFTDRVARGTLLVALRGTEVIGYVLYDLPGDRIKVIHLCVNEDQRHTGVARALIDEVSARHSERRGVELACRRDYPANRVWPHLGFVPREERTGRSDAGLPLTIWFRDHGHPDLFTFIPGTDPDDRFAVVLDHNIVIDLLSRRDEAEESTRLEDSWLTEHVVLCITGEVDQEIDKCEDPALRKRMRRGLPRFRRLSASLDGEGGWEDLVPSIRAAAPRVDPADHNHVARAMAGGASFLVSRDRRLHEAAEPILAATGVRVMRPAELIAYVDRLRRQERYEPSALHATSVSLQAAVGTEVEFVRRFLNYAEGERRAHLETVLRRALAEPAAYEVFTVADASGTLLGGLVRTREGDTLNVQLMRVGSSDSVGFAVARQLAYLQRQEVSRSRKTTRVIVTDQYPPGPVRYALEVEAYQRSEVGWTSEVRRGLHAVGDIPEMAGAVPNEAADLAAASERHLWPMKVMGAGLSTFVVSIRPAFAEQLFDSNLAARTLFGRDTGLGLSREHVYYRRPLNAGKIAAPARILWYVSGHTAGQSEGSIRAISQLAEVVVDRPRTVHRRFARLGVYNAAQVSERADKSGRVMALRFTDTELFHHPLGLSTLRNLAESEGMTFVAPQSPRRIDERLFTSIYREASIYAS